MSVMVWVVGRLSDITSKGCWWHAEERFTSHCYCRDLCNMQ